MQREASSPYFHNGQQMKPKDERDPWAYLQELLHPASGAPAVEVRLAVDPADGMLGVKGFNNRVGLVAQPWERSANDSQKGSE